MIDLPLVIVEWDDAHVEADTPVTADTVRDTHKPTRIHTIGWILLEDETGISIVNEFYDDTYRGRTFIPRGMIAQVTPYRLSKPKMKKGPE